LCGYLMAALQRPSQATSRIVHGVRDLSGKHGSCHTVCCFCSPYYRPCFCALLRQEVVGRRELTLSSMPRDYALDYIPCTGCCRRSFLLFSFFLRQVIELKFKTFLIPAPPPPSLHSHSILISQHAHISHINFFSYF
jgi:hypothetical protein